MDTKYCNSCQKNKPLSQWYNNKKFGISSYCKECISTKSLQRQKDNPLSYLESQKRHKLKIKTTVMMHYGSDGIAKCAKCGYNDIRALSIDHIDGKGCDHRKELGRGNGSGKKFYKWLIKNNFPDGYQVLCMNCQFIKSQENHEYNMNVNKKPQ